MPTNPTPREQQYTQVHSGEWVQPTRKGYKMECCDCGLVHTVDFRIITNGRGSVIQLRAFRDEKATKQKRKHAKPTDS